jgi:putative aldouronate transport system permease protein
MKHRCFKGGDQMKKISSIPPYDLFLGMIMTGMSLIFIYPLILTLAISFSDSQMLASHIVFLLPRGLSFAAYARVFENPEIWRYYANTVIYASLGTFLVLLVTSLFSYPLTIKGFRGKKIILILLTITLFFGGGVIQNYLLYRSLYMIDTVLVMVLPGAISAWNVIIFRTFFQNIPDSIKESAYLDGAGHFRVLFSLIIPLSKVMLATITLMTVVSYWNSYLSALLYLNSHSKMPIQMFLRSILVSLESMTADSAGSADLLDQIQKNPRTVKSAVTIVVILPILCIYPFLQKYFTQGIMIGSIKE